MGNNTNKKRISLRNCEIVSNLEYIDLDYINKKIKTLVASGNNITEYAYIIHDKDTYDEDGETSDGRKYKKGDLKAPHIHLMLKFKTPQMLHCIANWFEVKENNVNKIKGKWVSAIRYLTHANHPEKHQYDDSEVVCNFDYSSEKEKMGYNKNADKIRKEETLLKIANGELKPYDIYGSDDLVGALDKINWDSDIRKALNNRQVKLQLNETGRDMQVIYMCGGSGSGKTTLAREYAEKRGLSVYVSSGGKNPMDNYMGQECIILDDFRPDIMSLSDMLKLLDNHTASMVNARYFNKFMGECKLIIITTIDDIPQFFQKIPNKGNEPIKQLERRCSTKMIIDETDISYYKYDGSDYVFSGMTVNPLKDRMFEKKNDVDINEFADMFGVEVKKPKLKKVNSVKSNGFEENITFDSVYG